MKKLAPFFASLLLWAATACAPDNGDDHIIADMVLTNGVIYAADEQRSTAEAIAVKGDEIIFVGANADVASLIGPETNMRDLAGAFVMPGLIDSHIHPVSSISIVECDLRNEPKSLSALSAFVKDCMARYEINSDGWFTVALWNYASGNEPGVEFATLREALDAVSTETPIILMGSDGHHSAVNSAALAKARNANGEEIGISEDTLKTDFADFAVYVGTDENGEPNGRVAEMPVLYAMGASDLLTAGLDKKIEKPELFYDVTIANGITAVMDAAADPETLAFYDALTQAPLKTRITLATYLDPDLYRNDAGKVDYDRIIALANETRDRFAPIDNINADFLKLFADGVLEGDPLAVPPSLPNAALSRPYLQPIFATDDNNGELRVIGYIDPESPACAQTEREELGTFITKYGFHPTQCDVSSGTLQYDADTIFEFFKRGDAAGYTIMAHVIGDRATTVTLDAIEALETDKRHILTHIQLVSPDDVTRFHDLGVYASLTFAWALQDPPYDMTVLPFIDDVTTAAGMYNPDSYYMQNAYRARSIQNAGGVLIAGSDAPVDTRDPRPFINIAVAVSRKAPGSDPLNASESISIHDAIAAYTLNAARALNQDALIGTIEPGKKADFIILDRNIVDLAENGETNAIWDTKVMETWFDGDLVYAGTP